MENELKKKITIKDLCPEEKGKIGELLKKLAKEKEEKEQLLKAVEEEKQKAEQMESIIKEKENSLYNNSVLLNSSNNFNSSFNFNLKPESFSEHYIPTISDKDKSASFADKNSQKNVTLDDIKNLRTRFDRVYQKLKKTADNQHNYLNKIAGEDNKNIEGIPKNNRSLCHIDEDKPKNLTYEKNENNVNKNFICESEKAKTELYKISLDNYESDYQSSINQSKLSHQLEELKCSEEVMNSSSNKSNTLLKIDKQSNQPSKISNLNLNNQKDFIDKPIDNLNIDNQKILSKNNSREKCLQSRKNSNSLVSDSNPLRKNLDDLFNDNKGESEINTFVNKIEENISSQDLTKNKISFAKEKSISNAFQNKNFSKYKNILNRVREDSQDEAKKIVNFEKQNVKTNLKVIRNNLDKEKSNDHSNTNANYENEYCSDNNFYDSENSHKKHDSNINHTRNHIHYNEKDFHKLNKEKENIGRNDNKNRIIPPKEANDLACINDIDNNHVRKFSQSNLKVCNNNKEILSDEEFQDQRTNNKTEYYYFDYEFKKKKKNVVRENSIQSINSKKDSSLVHSKISNYSKKDDRDNKFFDQSVNRFLCSSNVNDCEEEENDPMNTSINSNLSISKLNFHIKPSNNRKKKFDETLKSNKSLSSDYENKESKINLNKFARNKQDDFLQEMSTFQNKNANLYNNNQRNKRNYNKNNYENYEENENYYFERSLNKNYEETIKNNCNNYESNDENLDEDVVFFLNSKNSKYSKNKNDFRNGQGMNHRSDIDNPSLNKRIEFYNDNLFDLIDDMEKKKESKNLTKNNNMQRINYNTNENCVFENKFINFEKENQ